jgi:SWI/SNF-related matrix-associated actin-dependent regulator 1 of chromatin subfamily A
MLMIRNASRRLLRVNSKLSFPILTTSSKAIKSYSTSIPSSSFNIDSIQKSSNRHKWLIAQKRAQKKNDTMHEALRNRFVVSFQLFEENETTEPNVLITITHSNRKLRENEQLLTLFLKSCACEFNLKQVELVRHNEEDFKLDYLDENEEFDVGRLSHFVVNWNFYEQMINVLTTFNEEQFGNALIIQQLPDFAKQVMKHFVPVDLSDDDQTMDWSLIPQKIVTNLLPYQKDGIIFGVKRNGRILLADEMGLGKTLQAIGLACYYKKEWPLLIVCPSALRMNWKSELLKWNAAQENEINVIDSSTKIDTMLDFKVNIISYELLSRGTLPTKPKVVIVDESHFVKSTMSKRTRAVRPIIRQSKHAILLSGTATPSRPIEIYDQIKPLFNDKKVKFMTKGEFGGRYCELQETAFGTDYSGADNLPELNLLLNRSIMIRRLKQHVLIQLQPKNRRLIFISRTYDDSENDKIAQEIQSDDIPDFSFDDEKDTIKQMMFMFQLTGRKKLPLVREYLRKKIFSREDDEKFLIFAHHQEVLDGIEEELRLYNHTNETEIDYIRIDGNTPNGVRPELAEYFCSTPHCKIAILSLTCAGTGLNFQKNCSNVIFAELFWTPGTLLQAEDRVHRIGTSTKSAVEIRYLVCDDTLDDRIWPMIKRKLNVVGVTLDRQHLQTKTEASVSFETSTEDELC